jgi:hypothetical protein
LQKAGVRDGGVDYWLIRQWAYSVQAGSSSLKVALAIFQSTIDRHLVCQILRISALISPNGVFRNGCSAGISSSRLSLLCLPEHFECLRAHWFVEPSLPGPWSAHPRSRSLAFSTTSRLNHHTNLSILRAAASGVSANTMGKSKRTSNAPRVRCSAPTRARHVQSLPTNLRIPASNLPYANADWENCPFS